MPNDPRLTSTGPWTAVRTWFPRWCLVIVELMGGRLDSCKLPGNAAVTVDSVEANLRRTQFSGGLVAAPASEAARRGRGVAS